MTSGPDGPGLRIILRDGIQLRPLEAEDARAIARAYVTNAEHLEPWEPIRDISFFTAQGQQEIVDASLDDEDDGRGAHFVLESEAGRIVGRVNVDDIARGAFQSANIGYWIDASLTGKGVMTAAVGGVLDYCRDALGLHRVQAGTLVHNHASQRVLTANGFERFGLAPSYLRIAGEWQDHVLFQRILAER